MRRNDLNFKKTSITTTVLLGLLFWVTAVSHGQTLTDVQKQKLAKAESALKQANTNLQLAQSSAGNGTATLTGSKAKLTKVRLDSAVANVPNVKQWLADLPAEHADVKTVQAGLDEIEESIAALEERLSGKSATPKPVESPSKATSPNDGQNTAPMKNAPATVKMGYQQVDLLKAAKFNLREVEGNTASLLKLLAEWKPVTDPLSIDHRKVQVAMNTIENATRKSGFTNDSLDSLPANGEGVAEVVQRLATANSQIAESVTFLKPLHQKLSALVDPANYPQLKSDFDRLNELSAMYRDPMIFQNDRPRAASVLTEVEAATEESKRIVSTYARLIEQNTEEGKRIKGSSGNLTTKIEEFLAAAEQEKTSLPTKIRDEIGKADEMANRAVEEQKPLFFTGGIPQMMNFIQEKIELYKVLDPENSPALQQELEQFQTKLDQREKSLESLIIKENPLPSDQYKGADRGKVVDVAVDAWTYQQKKFDVLASRIPSDNWARETKWQYSNGAWYFVDRSKLQVQLIVADEQDKSLAIIRPVTIIMDHQKGDSLIGTPMYSGKDELQPSAYLLRDKIK